MTNDRTGNWGHLSATQQLSLRGLGVLGAVVLLGVLVGARAPRAVATGESSAAYTGTAILSQFTSLRQSLDETTGELELTNLRLERAEAIVGYSARYQIPSDLVELVYDHALRAGIDPDLAFRLVKVESNFIARARSSADAYGLAQVQPATARFYQSGILAEQLYDPATNLRIGFRYFSDLLRVYGDVKLALLAYNRGPSRLKKLLDEGRDPTNGYASRIMDGYPGTP